MVQSLQVEGSVLSRLLRAWVNEPRGRVLLAGWAVTFVGVTGRAVFLRLKLKARRALKPPAEKDGTLVAPPPPSRPPKAPGPLRTVLRLAMPSYWSRSAAWLGVFSLGLGVRLAVSVKVSSEIGSLGSLLAKGEWEELFSRQLTYALWALPAAATTALQKFSRERAALCLRERLLQTVVDKLGAAGADAPLMPAPEGTATRRLPGALAAAAEGSADTSRGGAVGVCLTDPAEFCSSAVELYEVRGCACPALPCASPALRKLALSRPLQCPAPPRPPLAPPSPARRRVGPGERVREGAARGRRRGMWRGGSRLCHPRRRHKACSRLLAGLRADLRAPPSRRPSRSRWSRCPSSRSSWLS